MKVSAALYIVPLVFFSFNDCCDIFIFAAASSIEICRRPTDFKEVTADSQWESSTCMAAWLIVFTNQRRLFLVQSSSKDGEQLHVHHLLAEDLSLQKLLEQKSYRLSLEHQYLIRSLVL